MIAEARRAQEQETREKAASSILLGRAEPSSPTSGSTTTTYARGLLALGPGHDPGRENEEVKVLRGQQYGDTLSLTHQAQVRFDEFDPRHVGIAKGLADDHNVRAARGRARCRPFHRRS